MLKQLLNVNNGLLLILTLNNTDLSNLSLTVQCFGDCDCNFLVQIKLQNLKIKFSGHF